MAPEYFSGASGRIVVPSGTGGTDLSVETGTFDRTATLADIGNSTSGGYGKSKKIRKDGRLNVTMLWDLNAIPESLSLDAGDEVSVDIYLGDSGKKYMAVPITVESLAVAHTNQTDVVKATLTARTNGAYPDPS